MLFQKTTISPIMAHKGLLPAHPADHLLFSVEDGLGKLRSVWYSGDSPNASPYDANSSSGLMLGDTPLLQVQSNGCPTCQSLLAAGYGLLADSKEAAALRKTLDGAYMGLEEAQKRLHPLLALLRSGIYILTYSSYYPTDGNGHFFWNVPETLTPYPATAEYYETMYYRSFPCFPCFFYPTQDARKYDSERVTYYRKLIREGKPLPPVLAYQVEGCMSALLDGHHRASACALEGVSVPTLTISRPLRCWQDGVPHILWPDETKTPLHIAMTPKQIALFDIPVGEQISKSYPFTQNTITFQRAWEPVYAAMDHYPTGQEIGALSLYSEVALTAQGIGALALQENFEEAIPAALLLHFAARQPGADRKRLALPLTAPHYPEILRVAAFEVLDSIKDDSEIDEIMIAILVDGERKYDPIYQIANGHWD